MFMAIPFVRGKAAFSNKTEFSLSLSLSLSLTHTHTHKIIQIIYDHDVCNRVTKAISLSYTNCANEGQSALHFTAVVI